MHTSQPYGLEEHPLHVGDGSNRLRTEGCAQPRALQPGDWLITGDRVLAEPIEGGNGTVLVWLTGGHKGHQIGIAARVPVALATGDITPRPDSSCEQSGHNPFRSSGFCARCGADVPVPEVPMPDWASPEGPWCLRQWLPFNVPDPKIDTCLLPEAHTGDCRGVDGQWHNAALSWCVGRLTPKSDA